MKTTKIIGLILAMSPLLPAMSGAATAGPADLTITPSSAAPRVPRTYADADVSAAWERIKDHPYVKREAFAASLERMAASLRADVQTVRTALPEPPEGATPERERTLKEFNETYTYLRSQLRYIRAGTADTWDYAKGRVVEAWRSFLAAHEKVRTVSAP